MKHSNFRSVLLLLGILLCFSVFASAQTITGKVISAEDRKALSGVSILIKGSETGTTSDVNGGFKINVPNGNAVLVFSIVGYLSKEISVGNQSMIEVSLNADNSQLNQVVVVGYGTVRKSDLTGSLASVRSKELNAFPAANVLQALSGRAPGVQVIQNTGAPGGAVSIRIRGTNSVQGSNEPLYVVDGFPTSGSNPTIVNNTDIESIEILKDASATAIYGSRGANGVVLITTKQGKSGKVQVDYDASYSVSTP